MAVNVKIRCLLHRHIQPGGGQLILDQGGGVPLIGVAAVYQQPQFYPLALGVLIIARRVQRIAQRGQIPGGLFGAHFGGGLDHMAVGHAVVVVVDAAGGRVGPGVVAFLGNLRAVDQLAEQRPARRGGEQGAFGSAFRRGGVHAQKHQIVGLVIV